MKRFLWVSILLLSVCTAAKLAVKPQSLSTAPQHARLNSEEVASPTETGVAPVELDSDLELLARYPGERELVAQLIEQYGHNARRIERTDSISGLRLLKELGDAAVCLYEDQPAVFHQLARLSTSTESSRLIGSWGQFLDPELANPSVTARLASELSRLPPRARLLAERTPQALPFLLADVWRVSRLIERLGPECLEPLAYVDLSDAASFRQAVAVLDRYGPLAVAATEELGPTGFLLVERFGSLISLVERDIGLRSALLTTAACLNDLEVLLPHWQPGTIANVMVHLNSRGLLDEVASIRGGLRLVVEHGSDGEQALVVGGEPLTDIIFRALPDGRVRNSIVQAVAQGGIPAAVAVEKFQASDEFHRVVARDGAPAVLAIAASCSAEEARRFLAAKAERSWTESMALAALRMAGDSGEKTLRLIDRDGIDRAAHLAASQVEIYQLLPLYDLSHLGGVVIQGHSPTRGELIWAGADAALIAVDIFSLLTFQPEGLVASETARTGIKSAARAGAKSATSAVVGQVVDNTASRATRTATSHFMRQVTEETAERSPAAAEQVVEKVVAEWTESLTRKSMIRMASGVSAKQTAQIHVGRVPSRRLGKYVGVNAAQAAVGLVAVRKMEEYLERRTLSQNPRPALKGEIGG